MVHCFGRYVNEMLCLCSLICVLSVNHLQKFFPPIGAVLELRSRANLRCLVNLAPSFALTHQSKMYHSLKLKY